MNVFGERLLPSFMYRIEHLLEFVVDRLFQGKAVRSGKQFSEVSFDVLADTGTFEDALHRGSWFIVDFLVPMTVTGLGEQLHYRAKQILPTRPQNYCLIERLNTFRIVDPLVT